MTGKILPMYQTPETRYKGEILEFDWQNLKDELMMNYDTELLNGMFSLYEDYLREGLQKRGIDLPLIGDDVRIKVINNMKRLALGFLVREGKIKEPDPRFYEYMDKEEMLRQRRFKRTGYREITTDRFGNELDKYGHPIEKVNLK